MARKRNTNEKQSHGQRTNDALNTITPSNNLNASLLVKPKTRVPFSKFSQRFMTKGTRNPIKGNKLQRPSTKETKFKPEELPKLINRIDPRTFRSAQPAKAPGRDTVSYTPAGGKTINIRLTGADLVAAQRNQSQALASETARAAAVTRNTNKSRTLASEVTAYNRAVGARGSNNVL